MQTARDDDVLWNGEQGAGGISWADRSRMGLLRGVIDAADIPGRRNAYMHALHLSVVKRELARAGHLEKVLDFGCGTGRFIEVLSEHSVYVAAADKEPSMVDAAQMYAGDHAGEIVCCEPAELPFESSTFDFTLCSSVLCVTMRELLQQILRELARVTLKNGTLLLLEQVSDRRGLPLTLYCDALSRAGFEVERAYPIRSGSSPFTKFVARNGWIPSSIFPHVAQAELTLTACRLALRRAGYTEFAVVARR